MDTINAPRGVIRSHWRATQCADFSHLCYKTCTPTDMDGLMEFGDKVFVMLELKHVGGHMPIGQRLAFERLVDALASAQRLAICIVAEHDTDAEFDISVAECQVVQFRFAGAWRVPRTPVTVRQAVDAFLRTYAPEWLEQ